MPCGEIIVEYHEFFKLLYSGGNMGRPLLVVNGLQNILFGGICVVNRCDPLDEKMPEIRYNVL